MKLMTLNQYMKMSKAVLIRKITKQLRTMPKAKLARLCYTMTKAKLPRLSIRKRKSLRYARKGEFGGTIGVDYRLRPKRKTKRRASPKQIAWRKKFAKMSKAGTLRKRRR